MRALLIDMQQLNEERYYKKNIDKMIKQELDIPEMEIVIDQGVALVEAWLNKSYYPSKNARLEALKPMDLRRLVSDVIVASCYCQIPELYTTVSAQLASKLSFSDHQDSIKTMGELIAVIAGTNAYHVIKESKFASLKVKANIKLSEETVKYASRVAYLPPMVVQPSDITTNYQSPHLTLNESVILGAKNHHEGDMCLDVINKKNQVPLKLNVDFLKAMDETPKKEPETAEQIKNFNAFKQQSQEMYRLMIGQGNEFYLTHKRCKRLRVYAQGYHISTQGTSYKKAMIELANEEVVELPQFVVSAGKYDGDQEKNYKFTSEPMSYEEAVKVANEYGNYPFVEMELV